MNQVVAERERKAIIAEVNREMEEMIDVDVMRFILQVVQSFKRKWGV